MLIIESTSKIIQMVKQEQDEAQKKENRLIIFWLPNCSSNEKKDNDKFNQNLIENLLGDLKVEKTK